MFAIHEQATVSSKGQVTLPKAIRQALGVSTGEKLTFDLHDGVVTLTRSDTLAHNDPAIAGFLSLLEEDIRKGKAVGSLPEDLMQAMLANIDQPVNLAEDIEDDVAL